MSTAAHYQKEARSYWTILHLMVYVQSSLLMQKLMLMCIELEIIIPASGD